MSNNKARDFLEKYGKPGVHFPKEIATLDNWSLDPEHAREIIDHNLDVDDVGHILIKSMRSKHATPQQLTRGLKHNNWGVRWSSVQNKNLTSEQITDALNDKTQPSHIKSEAIKHNNATLDHVKIALNDPMYNVRVTAAASPKMTENSINDALNSPHDGVKEFVMTNPNVTSNNLYNALKSKNPATSRRALMHPRIESDHLDVALQSGDNYTRYGALTHEKTTKEHLIKGLSDPEPGNSAWARFKLSKFK